MLLRLIQWLLTSFSEHIYLDTIINATALWICGYDIRCGVIASGKAQTNGLVQVHLQAKM